MDHVFELVPAACKRRKFIADRIFRQFDVTGLSAANLVGRSSIGCKQPGIRGVGLGFDADQRAVSTRSCGL